MSGFVSFSVQDVDPVTRKNLITFDSSANAISALTALFSPDLHPVVAAKNQMIDNKLTAINAGSSYTRTYSVV
jgi:hypothetical protein